MKNDPNDDDITGGLLFGFIFIYFILAGLVSTQFPAPIYAPVDSNGRLISEKNHNFGTTTIMTSFLK